MAMALRYQLTSPLIYMPLCRAAHRIQEHILRLQVPVEDAPAVEVGHGLEQLPEDLAELLLEV